MAITTQAPYAATSAVVKILDTYRDTGLGGGPIDVALLGRLGLGNVVATRALHALGLLGLIDPDGRPTASLTAFKEASSSSYKQLLADVLYDVYAPVFAVTGKTMVGKTPSEIDDAFRTFKPDSLRKRMVTLFLGLCEYAGVVESPPKAKPGPKQGKPAAPRKLAPKGSTAEQKPKDGPPPLDPPPLTSAHQKYVDLLLAKATEQDTPDADLLDRIERALGIAPKAVSTS